MQPHLHRGDDAEVSAAAQRPEQLGLSTAPMDESAAESLREATKRYRAGLEAAAVRMSELGALSAGMTVDEATDLLWYYFGYASFFTLTEDNGWSPDRTEEWLRDAAAHSLLKD